MGKVKDLLLPSMSMNGENYPEVSEGSQPPPFLNQPIISVLAPSEPVTYPLPVCRRLPSWSLSMRQFGLRARLA